jgi:hypothetical protein
LRASVCQLARLPQVDQAFGALLELFGHVVEGLDGAPDFIVAAFDDARRQVPSGEFRETPGELLDGAADAVRQVDQQGERQQPERRHGEDVIKLEPAMDIALAGGIHQFAGCGNLAPQAGDVAQAGGIYPDIAVMPDQVIQAVAFLLVVSEPLGLLAFREAPHGLRPRVASGGGELLGLEIAIASVRFEIGRVPLVKFLAGAKQRLGERIDLVGRMPEAGQFQ